MLAHNSEIFGKEEEVLRIGHPPSCDVVAEQLGEFVLVHLDELRQPENTLPQPVNIDVLKVLQVDPFYQVVERLREDAALHDHCPLREGKYEPDDLVVVEGRFLHHDVHHLLR